MTSTLAYQSFWGGGVEKIIEVELTADEHDALKSPRRPWKSCSRPCRSSTACAWRPDPALLHGRTMTGISSCYGCWPLVFGRG